MINEDPCPFIGRYFAWCSCLNDLFLCKKFTVPNSVIAFLGFHSFCLFDVVVTATVVGVID